MLSIRRSARGMARAAITTHFRLHFCSIAIFIAAAPAALAQSRTYTLDADFDEGVLINVNHESPNNDQLQLNATTTPFPFVNVACSSRGTLVRIDVNTGAILGEYLTAPNGMGRNPSRTTVDLLGNVWVSNRDESGFSGEQNKGSITRVGLIIGGTRTDAAGNPDPAGQYLKPPFAYSTCADRDGDGLIRTSIGLGNVLPWTNAGGADTHGGVSTADDECIINYTRIAGTNARTVAIDASNDVWTGGLGDLDHEKVSGISGLPVPGTQFNLACGGYGGLVDGFGILWSARGGSGLLRYDPVAAMGMCLDFTHGDYGLGIDPNTGHIWQTRLFGGSVVELDSSGTVLNDYPHGFDNAQGVAVDSIGNVWVAHSLLGGTTVGHIRTDGLFVGSVSLPGGNGPTGVAVDANGKIWVTNANTNNAQRIDPAAGPIGGGGFPVGAVDLTVDLGAGAGPYNYSDMTGFVSIGTTAPQGTWTVVHDTGMVGTDDCNISWNSSEPTGTNVIVEVRAADDQVDLPSEVFVPVVNGVDIVGVMGRFYEIRSTLSRGVGVSDTPILFDLTISCGITPCFVLDFETEDDLSTPLVNGQHIDSEFGNLFTLTSSGMNAGLAIFDSTIGGPNDPSQDPDLLVDTGNVLILQTENLPPDGFDVFPRPNDDSDGGTVTFSFASLVGPRSVRLIDMDMAGSGSVTLTDETGKQRIFTVPANWTGDRTLAQPAEGTLDLTTLADQPGFGASVTASEDAGFDPEAVTRVDIHLDGSGGIDDLSWCVPGAAIQRGATVVRNGAGVNPSTLGAVTSPLVGGTWGLSLDCSAHLPSVGLVVVKSAATSGSMTPYGEILVRGGLLMRRIVPHNGNILWFMQDVPGDASLSGLEAHAQGLCTGAPGPRLSNAIDATLGF